MRGYCRSLGDPQSSSHSEESSPSMDGRLLPLAAWRELSSGTLPQLVYSIPGVTRAVIDG